MSCTPGEATVAGQHQHDRAINVLGRREEFGRAGRIGFRRFDDDASHAVAIGTVRNDARLRPEIWEAAMSSIAFVILRVDCTDLIRRRRILSCPPAIAPPFSLAL